MSAKSTLLILEVDVAVAATIKVAATAAAEDAENNKKNKRPRSLVFLSLKQIYKTERSDRSIVGS